MKKALSLLLFVVIAFGMSMPLYAGELKMMNGFSVKMFTGDRTAVGSDLYLGSQTLATSLLETRGSYSSEPGFSLNWWVEFDGKGWGYSDSSEDAEINYKVLFAKWEAERFAISAGYLDLMWGNGWNIQCDGVGGFLVDLKPSKATTITLAAILYDEGVTYDDDDYYVSDNGTDGVYESVDAITGETVYYTTDDAEYSSDDAFEDTWWFGIQAAHNFNEATKAKLYYLLSHDLEDSDNDYATLGFAGDTKIGDIMVGGEMATFLGDSVSGFFADAEATMQVNEQTGVLLGLYYAQGTEDDEMVAFAKRGMHQPLQTGLGPVLDHEDKTLQLIGLNHNSNSINNGGVIGTALGVSYKTSQKTTLSSGLFYGMSEADDDIAQWGDVLKLNASVSYAASKSLNIGVGASYLTFGDSDDKFDDDMWGSQVTMSWSF
jgi:hypothetical protein